MRGSRIPFLTFFILLLFVSLATSGWAQIQESAEGQVEERSRFDVDAAVKASRLASVIVKLEDPSLAAARGGAAAISLANEPDRAYVEYLESKLDAFEAACETIIPDARMVHRYTIVFGGASVLVPRDQLHLVSTVPGVVAVYEDELMPLSTVRSPQFIGADKLWRSLGGQRNAGDGVVVGVLDSGVWPEHPSYSDPDPRGKPYDPPPVVPGSNGFGSGGPRSTCDFGNTAFNPNDAAFSCNNKLIGAYNFTDTYKAVTGFLPEEFDSARDADGHGTHTSSTAVGNGGVDTEVLGVMQGVASGIAPRAHLIMYKNCGDIGCYTSDSVSAVEQAVLDDVDVINFSISGGSSPYSDIVSLAFLEAYHNDVLVAASAGNDGPGADTTSHREPWTLTVGASTTDRHYLSDVTLVADNSDVLTLTGASITSGISVDTPVVFPPAGGELCLTPFAPGTFSGEIVICRRGIIARVEKSFNVAEGGAGGMLLYNPVLQGLSTDSHFIPSVHLENDAGQQLLDFMATHTGVTGTFTDGTASVVQGDVMAAFSSRGGPGQSLGISKPDVTAPGVQILAGHTPMPATVVGGLPGQLFQVIQGTSMSSPHVAGAAALVKQLRPDWTPGEIKSALMTTAKTMDVFKEDGVTAADAFDLGSGRIDLSRVRFPGLTFVPASALDFLNHAGDLWNANYPSLYIPVHPGVMSVTRTVQSEIPCGYHGGHGSKYSKKCDGKKLRWQLHVDAPSDVQVDVPRYIKIPYQGQASFDITVDARNVPIGETRFATLKMRSGYHRANFPITIVRQQANVTSGKTCDPTELRWGGTTECTITVENTSFDVASVRITDRLPKNLRIVPGSVVGATGGGRGRGRGRELTFEGTLDGVAPRDIHIETGVTPVGGYLPLSLFFAPIAGVGDETIVNLSGFGSFVYAGKSWSNIGLVSNGYAVVGGGSAADIDYLPQTFPDPTAPNNVLAPFWTDLDPGAGGNTYAGSLTDGVNTWLVLEWEDVPAFGTTDTYTFQIWIQTNEPDVEDITIAYGPLATLPSALSVGAENEFGNSGANYTNPVAAGEQLQIFSTPGAPGETHTISFKARGVWPGKWQNCAEMTGDIFHGTSTACVDGEVKRRRHRRY